MSPPRSRAPRELFKKLRRPVFLISWILALAALSPAEAREVRVTVVFTNDIHGHLFPGRDDLAQGEPRPILGGGRALARLVAQARADRSKDGGVLLLDGGDIFHGSPEGDLTDGRAMVDFFNLLGYDAAVLGNHEFAVGQARLAELVGASRFSWLAANFSAPKEHPLEGAFRPVIRREVAGVKVAIIGVTTPYNTSLNDPEHTAGLSFPSPFPSLPPMVKKLRAEGAIVLVVSHMGSQLDEQLALLLPDAVAIIGGHDHVVLEQGGGLRSPITAQTGEYLRRAGRMDLRIELGDDGRARVLDLASRIHNLAPVSGPAERPLEAKALAFLEEARFRTYDIPVARAERSFPRNLRNRGPSRIGGLAAQALRKRTGADAAFVTPGALRGGLPAGVISLRDLYLICPFDDEVQVLELNGPDLVKAFRGYMRRGDLDLGLSGIEMRYDVTAGARRRITEVRANGKPLAEGQTYRLAVTGFTARRLVTDRRLKPKSVVRTGLTTFDCLLSSLDVEPAPAAAAGGLIGAACASSAGRRLVEVPEPIPYGVHERSPVKLWSANKIDLNSAGIELLGALPWLDDDRARAILAERERRGGSFKSLDELLAIPGVTSNELKRMSRFLKVSP